MRRIYVANLPAAPDAAALRAHFGTCGAVSNVEVVADRNAGRGRGTAFVDMSNEAGATRALAELNGSLFQGQLLLLEAGPEQAAPRGSAKNDAKQSEQATSARITTQFRELTNMTYELDCKGTPLVLRVFFPAPEGQWRIQAQASRSADAPSASSTAGSRVQALRGLAQECRDSSAESGFAHIDWAAVELAMVKVRAL